MKTVNPIELAAPVTPDALQSGDKTAPAEPSSAKMFVQHALRGAELAATGVVLAALSPVILSMHASQMLHKRFFDNGDTAA